VEGERFASGSWRSVVELGQLLEAGQIRPIVAAVYALERARDAYTRGPQQHQPGKVVLRVA
jgi:NADPH:quinone reductase-like Zn-dependent oxidoreductase